MIKTAYTKAVDAILREGLDQYKKSNSKYLKALADKILKKPGLKATLGGTTLGAMSGGISGYKMSEKEDTKSKKLAKILAGAGVAGFGGYTASKAILGGLKKSLPDRLAETMVQNLEPKLRPRIYTKIRDSLVREVSSNPSFAKQVFENQSKGGPGISDELAQKIVGKEYYKTLASDISSLKRESDFADAIHATNLVVPLISIPAGALGGSSVSTTKKVYDKLKSKLSDKKKDNDESK